MILVVDYDKGIVNKCVFNNDKEINYPFFGNDMIDNYINNYLGSYIDSDDNIFIDYDYSNNDNNYYITFYKYILNGSIINDSNDSFVIDMDNNSINRIYNSYYEYDFITNSGRNDDRKFIAITFDDGPNYNTNKILNILEKYDAKATFFVLGSRIHGDLVLMHDIYSATANALEVIIPTLMDMGYEFVTVSDLFYYKGITLENGKVYGYAR